MKIEIAINDGKKLAGIMEEFNRVFPFLSLEFYEFEKTGSARILEPDGITVGKYRKPHPPGILSIFPEMSVSDLEKILIEQFGLYVYVTRKSGNVWLKTSHTHSWSLQEQNKLGAIVSEHINKGNNNKRIQ